MTNPFLEQMTKVMADGLQLTQGVRDEMQTAFKDQAEKFFASMNLAHTEEVELLKERIEALEAKVDSLHKQANPPSEGGGA